MRMVPALIATATLIGCDREAKAPASAGEPVRRAAFRAMIARDFLASCPGGAMRAATLRQAERHGELKVLGTAKRASHALWLGENDHAGLARHGTRAPCAAGEAAYRAALADYGATLDALAARIAEYRP